MPFFLHHSPVPADVVLHEGTPGNQVKIGDVIAKGKTVVFGVPGAFTPGCSKTHLPSYVEQAEALKAKGVKEIICISVNDSFVHSAWGAAQGAEGKVRMLADYKGELTKALGLDVDLTDKLGSVRSKRYSALLQDGEVKALHVEPDGLGLSCSLAKDILKDL